MAQTLVNMLSHVVFSTKHRKRLIVPALEARMYRYIGGIVKDLNSRCLAINGTENHVHMLVSLSKTVALADLIRQVKASSSKWVKSVDTRDFQWQEGYGAFSVSQSNAPAVVAYIAQQKIHHQTISFEDEYRRLVEKANIEFDERYLLD